MGHRPPTKSPTARPPGTAAGEGLAQPNPPAADGSTQNPRGPGRLTLRPMCAPTGRRWAPGGTASLPAPSTEEPGVRLSGGLPA